jgi:creatinine amidohydrolase
MSSPSQAASGRDLRLARLTWEEVQAELDGGTETVLIPVGTTEQHGPHMPLDTDCVIAESLAIRCAADARAEGVRVLVAPTINVSLSWYHMQFPGSLRLSTDTFLAVFDEVCESLAHHGFRSLIAVNGHGGNVAALTVAINRHLERTGRRVFLLGWWDLGADVLAEIEGPQIHAEEAETSIAMACGQRVLTDKLTRDAYDRGNAVREAGLQWTSLGRYSLAGGGPGVVVPMDMLRDISASGVVGDSTRATRETGERVLAAVIPRMVQVCREMSGAGAAP